MSEYKRRNAHNISTLTEPEDNNLNPNAKVPTSPYHQYHEFDITSPPPYETSFKLSQSTSSYPVNQINTKQTNIYLLPGNIHNNNNRRHKQNNNKRRASQPHINQTMCYEPIGFSPSDSPVNILNNEYNYTKRELNEIRMKHYNQIYQIKKTQKRNQNKRIYNYTEYNTKSTLNNKCNKNNNKKRRHSMGSPISIQNSCTSNSYEISTPLASLNNKHRQKQRQRLRQRQKQKQKQKQKHRQKQKQKPKKHELKKSKTSISRRQSKTNIRNKNNNKYTNQIQITKRVKKRKNKIKRTKSYDTSYDDGSIGIYDEDPEIIDINNNNNNNNNKRKKIRMTVYKSSSSEQESKSISNSISNKKILRVRDGKLGERVVTFSRRKSLLDGQLIGFESPKTDYIPLMSPLSSKSEYLIDLQKTLENEKIKLDKEKEEFELLKKKHENEYKNKCKLLELKEKEYEEKQSILLRDEAEIDVNKHKLLRKEKLINKQQHKFVKETDKFDRVICDFYFYQKTINAIFNKHIILINKWLDIAQNIANNFINTILKDEKYQEKIEEINDFDEINKLQNELKTMPRPSITKKQSMQCEMRLQQKWRDYLSIKFDEYISLSSPNMNMNNDSSDTQNTIDLLDEHIIINIDEKDDEIKHNDNDNDNDNDDDDDDHKMIENIMKFKHENDKHNNINNTSFVRNKQHNRSSASFIKTGTFLDNLNPFWCLKYDSGNDMDDIDEMDLSRNSNSSAVIQSIDDIEDVNDKDLI